MLLGGETLIRDFAEAADQLDLQGWPCALQHELLPAPHIAKPLRSGHGAVYAFAFGRQHESVAGVGMVLKVGRVGSNSNARFQSQHYGFSAGSTLAKSLLGHQVLWPWLGIRDLDKATIKPWMLANLDRLHTYVPASAAQVLPVLEMYVRARIGSVFEGSA